MKILMSALLLVFSHSVLAAGPSVSGGIPPAARAVVLQFHLADGFDYAGHAKATNLLASHLISGILVAFTQRPELQSQDRMYICAEYGSHQVAVFASKELKALLAGHPSIEVVANGGCR